MKIVAFTLNGKPACIRARPGESLMEVLRNQCGTISLKNGCAPQGQCGGCLALIDGLPKTSCAVPAEKAAGNRGR